MTYGATRDEWKLFARAAPFADLLPVVSNPNAKISSTSKLKTLGKTPSRYYGGKVGGIPNWTAYQARKDEITAWSQQEDYGICVQTRTVRAVDVDIEGPQAAEVLAVFADLGLPCRTRENSTKFLLAFNLPGEYAKRVIRTEHGAIEFLATGQQFVAAGTHPSGARIEWTVFDRFPDLTPSQFEAAWAALETKFAVSSITEQPATPRAEQLRIAATADPTARALADAGLVLSPGRDGALHITCPFEEHHTGESIESSTTYFPANTGGFAQGHFHCLHAHCSGRRDDDYREQLRMPGYFFEPVVPEPVTESKSAQACGPRFRVKTLAEFQSREPANWIIYNVLPKAELGVVFGQPGCGKSFWTLDLVAAIARHEKWNGHYTRPASVAYLIAEGAGGFRRRVDAYIARNQCPDFDLGIIDGAPNMSAVPDIKELVAEIKKYRNALDLLVIDTLAATTPGMDENSSKDMGKVLANCKTLTAETGAMVLLVHHSGKSGDRGARGHSSLRGAADVEFEIEQCGDPGNTRVAKITKLKDGSDQGREWFFTLQPFELGTEEFEGQVFPIVSCTVAPAAAPIRRLTPGTLEDIEALIQVTLDAIVSDTSRTVNPSLNEVVDSVVAKMAPPVGRDKRAGKVRLTLNGMTDVLDLADGRVRFRAPDEIAEARAAEEARTVAENIELLIG